MMSQMTLVSEARFESNLANRQLILAEETRRPLDATADNELMDRHAN